MIAAIERLTGLEWKGQGTVFLVASGHGGTHWIAATFYLLLPFITRDLGLTYAEAGMLVAVFHLSAFAANFGSGLIDDVSGRRVVFQVFSLALGAAALLACGVAQGVGWLALMVALIGATNNLWHPPAISFLSEHFPKQRGYALSIHALGANVGDALAPLAAGALLVWLSWRGAASVSALPVFALAAWIAFALSPRDRPRDSHGQRRAADRGHRHREADDQPKSEPDGEDVHLGYGPADESQGDLRQHQCDGGRHRDPQREDHALTEHLHGCQSDRVVVEDRAQRYHFERFH